MRKILNILLCLSFCQAINAQYGRWQSYLSYNNTTKIAQANQEVFAVANGALYSFKQEDNSLNTYSRLNSLSDVDITQIGYNSEADALLIVYSNGNIDIIAEGTTYNLPFLKENTTIQDKTVNTVSFNKEYAYVSSQFGIMVVNLKKREVTDTYMIGNVYASAVLNNYVYAVTDEGVKKGNVNDNLLDSNNWSSHSVNSSAFEAKSIRNIASFQNVLCFYVPSNGVFYQTADGTVNTLFKDAGIKGFKLENGKLMSFTNGKVYISNSLTSTEQITGLSTIQDITTLKGNTYWIANSTSGILGVQKDGNSSSFKKIVEQPAINSPKRNLPYFMSHEFGQLLVTGGARWTDRENQPATFMRYKDNYWINFDESQLTKQTGLDFCRDILCAVTDPADTSRFFIASYGEGLFEIKDGQVQNHYTVGNSPLQSAAGTSKHYVRISGLTFDENGNLWIVSSGSQVNATINVLQKDGNWVTFNKTPINNSETTDKVIITKNKIKLINNIRANNAGIFAMDDKGTLDDTSDDTYKLYTSLVSSQGETLSASLFYCMAEDKNGAIWVGTNIGPVVCYMPSNIEDLRFNRIVLADESDYLLNGEQINAIAVDGGNRKWLATENSGVFLVNEDGTEVIENFTTDNSPLFSNRVQSIAIDPKTGEVFFGTDKGIVSYIGDATEGSEDFSSVHAYPNPVRPDFDQKVIITGLMDQSSVKITDVAGNLIYQGKCTGGQFSWDCRNINGRRVATGVYLVLSATEKAKESVVTKIMVIK